MLNQLSEDYGGLLPENLPTAWERFRSFVDNYPEDLALVATHQPAGLYGVTNLHFEDESYKQAPYLRWSYHGLAKAIDHFAAGLQAHGVHKGMPLITFVSNGVERIVSFFAANKLGCPFTAISPKNLLNVEETTHMIKVCLLGATADRPIFIAQDSSLAERIDALPTFKNAFRITIECPAKPYGWSDFAQLMESGEHFSSQVRSDGVDHVPNDCTVFFTSGTTSLPKGCRWVHPQLGAVIAGKLNVPGFVHGDKWCSVMPNNHAFANLVSMVAICSGTAIVYPGPVFEPQLMFTVLKREKINYLTLVPTMIPALTAVKNVMQQDLPHLKSIMLGGSAVTPQLLRQCIDDLDAQEVESAYGMTDGVFTTLGSQKDLKTYISGDEVAVGKALLGSATKICALGDTKPVPLNVPGELHFHGALSCDGYVGKQTDDWYTDPNGRRWFRTGDQARMDEKGRIFIVGRFKDIVIRGGKNLASAAMETNLARNPNLVPYNVQIVAAPDPIAGEVPVAVTETSISTDHALEIQDMLRKNMGLEFVPDEVLSVEQLGLNAFPRTILGKVKKDHITKLVREFRANRDAYTNGNADTQLANEVRSLWARAVGLPVERLSDDVALTDFADSITVMRVRDRIKRQTGRNMTIMEIAEAGTIGNLIKILQSRSPEKAEHSKFHTSRQQGPPGSDDMVHLVEAPELFEVTKEIITKTISPIGFCWEDVQDVLPAYDFATVLTSTGIMDSWNYKFAILPRAMDKKHVRDAVEAFLCNNPLMLSFLVWNQDALGSDLALHVTLRPSKKLMDTVIEDAGSIKTINDLKNTPFKYPHPSHARYPGPLIQFLLYEFEDSKNCGFVMNVNHAIIDASYGQIFQDDLERVFGSPETPELAMIPHPDYKLWADSYFSLRSSPEARRAVKWHQSRLKSLGTHRKALWPTPPQREPYDDAAVTGLDGVEYNFEAPGIKEFRQEHCNVTVPIFIKSALALVNTFKTKHTHALFANLEAARTAYPFITKAMSKSGRYEATEVAGPTFQSVINLVEIRTDEAVVAFLNRMQDEQTNLTKYASAPWLDLMSALGDAGQMLPEVTQAQIFNWVPGMGTTGTNPYDNFEVLSMVVRPQVGLSLNAGLGGPQGNTLFMHIRGDSLNGAKMLEMAKEVGSVMTWMVEKRNWDVPVGRFIEALKVSNGNSA